MRIEATKEINLVKREKHNFSLEDLHQHQAYLESVRNELLKLNESVFSALISDSDYTNDKGDAESERCAEYDESIIFLVASLKSEIGSRLVNSAQGNNSGHVNKVNLPQIPLPTFSNRDGDNLTKFLGDFELIVDKYNLSSYEKFVYLQRQLTNEPLTLIKSLEKTQQNYQSACDLLKRAFALSEIRLLQESFSTLQINADLVLQCFIWEKIPLDMKNQFTNITNSNYPNLEQINEHIFSAIDRHKHSLRKQMNEPIPKKLNSNAAAVISNEENKHYCRLCSTDSKKDYTRSTYECKKYDSPKLKLDKLAELNGCAKCANVNHTTSQCRYRFKKKCMNCGKFHFTFLCAGNFSETVSSKERDNKVVTKSVTEPVNSHSVFVGNALFDQYGEDGIIPTFSKRFTNGSVIRCMRDTGCQSNFITHKAAKRLNLKILSDSFMLNVTGFNSSKFYSTKLYELKIDEKYPSIKVFGMDEIRTKLKLPGLSTVVNHFESKGYQLADEFVACESDEIASLDFVLGNNDSHILQMKEIIFGENPPSMYIDSNLGILLTGSVKRLLNNLVELPALEMPTIRCCVSTCHLESPEVGIVDDDFTKYTDLEINVDPTGHIQDSMLDEAVSDIMRNCSYLQYDTGSYSDNSKLSDEKLNEYVLENAKRDTGGRLIVPLLWNNKVSHLLGKNLHLAKLVLSSNLKLLMKSTDKLEMYDKTLKSHLNEGIIEPVHDLVEY